MGAVAVEGFGIFVVVEVAVLVLVVDVVVVGAGGRPTIVAELWLSAKPSALGLVADCSWLMGAEEHERNLWCLCKRKKNVIASSQKKNKRINHEICS